MKKLACLLALALVAPAIAEPAAGGKLPLTQVADVPLTGRATRWDYASLDDRTGRLFLAHMGDDVVTVFDTKARRVVADIPGISNVHGVLVVPTLNRVYATATGSNQVVAIDASTFKVIARIPAGNYPDGLAYAPESYKIYVSDEHGGTDTVIDVRTNTRVATVKIGREVGNTQYDPVSKHIFVNEQASGELVEIDPATDQVVGRSHLPGARGNHGLYIEAAARLAYIACEDNDTLLVFDLATGQVTASFKVGGTPDVLAFDPPLGWLYVAGEGGSVSLFGREGRTLVKLGEQYLGPNAHVVAVDAVSHLAYFPLKDVGGRSVLRIMAAQRPAMR